MCRFVDGDYQPHAGYPSGHISPLPYSTEMTAAMIAIEGVSYEYGIRRREPNNTYVVWIGDAGNDEPKGYAVAETFMLAACRAIVLAALK